MHKKIDVYQFCDAFKDYGRQEQFSHQALNILFDYLEDWDSGYELDVIALCCEYSEDDPFEIALNYDIDIGELTREDVEAVRAEVLSHLYSHTSVVGVTDAGAIVFQQY